MGITLAVDLKRELLRLLDEDEEFRYAVAGRIGILEILKRLDRLEEGQEKLWEEVRSLREGQNKLWEEVRSLREGQNRLWEEVRSLREGQNKLWEGQNKLWEEVRDLRRAYQGLSRRVEKGFAELGYALGVTYETHAVAYIQVLLWESGYTDAKVGRGWVVGDGEVLEIDVFCEQPLLVGEVTTRIKNEEEMKKEIAKLLERIEAVSRKYGEKPFMTILSVGVVSENLVDKLRNETEKHSVKLILGREIEEALSA